ncbi:N-lysine methyltransferase KMT5A [Anabarilius grahami]|uniref:N-lysine methyltransferase KMT5A n=1 Tax=Anabarilius grahami TaxID=495550 RepID=A0A3N0XJE9_ANAGA|nr:N-lysine methyltransferase KMT5A [Anabarilius grahami]
MPRRITPLQDAINHILEGRDKNSMLEIRYINPVKGRGIFTLAVFNQGDFVVEYRGELIDAAEAEHRRKLYHNACSIFMFDFIWKRKTWCIDGALEDGSFGRLVNDEHKAPNCRMKLIEAEGKPHLCLFALKEITAGTEITYDYGGKEWPWRKEIPPTVTSTAAQESIKNHFQDQTMSSTVSVEETRERPEVQSCNITSGSSACETQLSGASIPSGQHSVAELGDHAHDLEPNVSSTDLFRDTESRAECQSFSPKPDSPEHEVHCVRGQCGTSPIPSFAEEVGVQQQEVPPPVFSTDLTSDTESRAECQSFSPKPDSPEHEVHCVRGQCGTSPIPSFAEEVGVQQQECTIHKLVFESDDVSSDDEYIPESVSDPESSGTELSVELPTPSKMSHTTNMPDLGITVAEQEQTIDIHDNSKNILMDLETTGDLQSDPEPESSESYQQKTKVASNEKGTVDILGQSKSPTKSAKFLKSQVNYCFVCGKPQTKFARHLERHVNENAEIALALQFPKSSKDRKVLLEKFRNLGNFKHNSVVKTTGSGCLKVKRSSKQSSIPETYDYCLYCKGMLSRKELSRHMKRCALRPENNVEEGPESRDRVFGIASAQSTMSQPISSELWSVLGKMHKDDVSTAIRNDHYLMQFAQSLFNKHGSDRSKHEYIRQKVRELGRLLVTLRHTTRIHNMEEAIKPGNFFILTSAVKRVSGFDNENNTFKAPSLALKIGHSLRKISDLIMCRALMEEDQEVIDSIRRFHTLHETKWSELVSHSALSNLSEAKYNKSTRLPLAKDVQKLQLYLGQQVELTKEKLADNPTAGSYAALAKVTLCQVILFNRRREGEVARMTVKNFEDRDMSQLNDDISTGLTEVEKRLCKQFARVELKGKKGRKVAVILTPDMTANLSLLISKRKECGVTENNNYLFAIPCSDGHYRGQFGQFADACGAEDPQNLRSTNLRKQIATISQVMNLKDNELDQLADFLGHDIRVHREYYRLPQSTIQLAKISKLLMAMEKGSVKDIQGKSLDEIGDDTDDIDTGSQQLPNVSTLQDNEEMLASVTLGSPHLSETAAEDDQGNAACVSSSSPHLPDSVTQGFRVSSRRCVKRPWSEEEIQAVMKHMRPFIENSVTVTNEQCLKCKEKEQPILEARSIQNIRDFVRNRGLAFKRRSNAKH